MRFLRKLCFLSLSASLMLAQRTTDTQSASGTVEDQIKVLRQALAAQQQAMAEQQKQISEQQQEIETLRQQVSMQPGTMAATTGDDPHLLANANLATAEPIPPINASSPQRQLEKEKASPLSFRIGGAEFTPGGFVDLTAFWRNTNPGTGCGTNFFSIPFHNTIPGQLSETRFTAENSRITLKVADNFKGNDVTGYYETDFHGNDPANLNVTSNSSTLRLR